MKELYCFSGITLLEVSASEERPRITTTEGKDPVGK